MLRWRADDTFRGIRIRSLWLSACVMLALAGGTASAGSGGEAGKDGARLHGVKLYLNQDDLQARYPDYDRLMSDLRQGGVNAVFTTVYEGRTAFYASRVLPGRNQAIDMAKLRRSARAGHLVFGAICHIFFDAETLATRPDLVPVDQNGDGKFVNWQTFVCPSDTAYRAYKLDVVREVARTLHPDILSLDFMRFPTTWEIIPASAAPQELRNFCFCERCLGAFQRASGVAIPSGLDTTAQKAAWILREHGREWEKWKTTTITSFVSEASRAVREIDPGIRISVHVVPWREEVFDRGLVRVAGQDVAAMAPYVDFLSPMIYHKLIGRLVEDIRALTAELQRKTGRAILPSIQAAQIEAEGELSADEFRTALENALAELSRLGAGGAAPRRRSRYTRAVMNSAPHSYILTVSCPDGVGLVAAVSGLIASWGGWLTEVSNHSDRGTNRFFMRNVVAADSLPFGLEEFRSGFLPLARRHQMEFAVRDSSVAKRVVILVSREAHCLADLLHRWRTGELRFDLRGVISNHEEPRGDVERLGVPFHHVPVPSDAKEQAFETIGRVLATEQVELVVLARYMQILPTSLCQRYAGRIVNIHHGFLPSFAGSRPYQQAYDSGVKLIGATSHFVTAELDRGPIIEQDVIRVDHTDTVDDMVRLGRDVEKTVLARAVRYVLEDRVLVDGNKTVVFR